MARVERRGVLAGCACGPMLDGSAVKKTFLELSTRNTPASLACAMPFDLNNDTSSSESDNDAGHPPTVVDLIGDHEEQSLLSSPAPSDVPGPSAAAAPSIIASHQASASTGAGAPSKSVRTIIHPTLAVRYPSLSRPEVDVLPSPADIPLSVHWARDARSSPAHLPRVTLVWESAEVLRRASDGSLLSDLRHAQVAATRWTSGCILSLVVYGKNGPGLERCLGALQVELALSVRRVLDEPALAELLAMYAASLEQVERGPSPTDSCDFLAGLTAHDVLHNKSVPKSLQQSWRGALRQLLPDTAASAVQEEYPSFRRLLEGMQEAEADGRPAEGCIAEVRVGTKRLGPARSSRLARIIMAKRNQAFDCV
jgi:hypothetical protein